MTQLALEDPQHVPLNHQRVRLRKAPRGSVVFQLVNNPLPLVDIFPWENPGENFSGNPSFVCLTFGLGPPQPQRAVRGTPGVELGPQQPVLDRGIGLAPTMGP